MRPVRTDGIGVSAGVKQRSSHPPAVDPIGSVFRGGTGEVSS
jgi:hypothetical protein